MAVKAPYGPTTVFNRSSTFGSGPESPWPKSAMNQGKANVGHGSIYSSRASSTYLSPASVPQGDDMATTPLDITAPSPSTSESSTVFTDLDADDEAQDVQPAVEKAESIQGDQSQINTAKSPLNNLKINTAPLNPPRFEEEDQPRSVIHIPSGFGRFVPPGSIHRTSSRLSQSHLAHRPHRSLSQSSSTVSAPPEPKPVPATPAASAPQPTQPPLDRPGTSSGDTAITPEPNSAAPSIAPSQAPSQAASAAASNTESTAPSESTLRAEQELLKTEIERSHNASLVSSQQNNGPLPLSPMSSVPDLESSKDWATTPRAQTRQEFFQLSRPGSSLASIREGDDDERSDHFPIDPSTDEYEQGQWEMSVRTKSEKNLEALELALSECWMLCNTLANLSHLHRERIFTNNSGKDDKQEQAWKSCWKLCQTLYESKDNSGLGATKSTLALCRDFCQALFEVRVRSNEAADSVLRVSFELNNHLFNTHDRNLPDSFRERTLEFYVALCHRLMKQKSKMGAETDSLLRACWTLAETLFSLRQSKKNNGKADQDVLGQAMQACWDLCDLFRAGWTQVRPDRGSSRNATTTFSQAFQTAKKAGHIDDSNTLNKITPETPTTIFDDTATVSPDDVPVPTISVMGSRILHSTKGGVSTPSAMHPRPNTTQRISRSSNYSKSQDRWGSINEALLEDDEIPPTSAVSQNSLASSHVSLVPSIASSQHTIRTPAEDPSLTMLKALFIRAAVATGRGFSPDPRSSNRDPTYTSLPLFARSLPENAFGSQSWQRELLEHYKKTVAQDATFKNLGTYTTAIGMGIDPEKGREDIAGILKGLVENTAGWGWLRDLFRYGYGTSIDEVLSKPHRGRDSSRATSRASRSEERSLPNGSSRSNGSNAGIGMINGTGNETKKVSPPRR